MVRTCNDRLAAGNATETDDLGATLPRGNVRHPVANKDEAAMPRH